MFPAFVLAVVPRWRFAQAGFRPRSHLVSPHRDALFYQNALRRNQRSSEKRRRMFATGKPRFARFAHARWRREPNLAGAELTSERHRFSPIRFFLTKNPLPSAIDTTERACGLRPCR
jgi:hypothetical protein